MESVDRESVSLYQVVVLPCSGSAPPILIESSMTYRDAINGAVELSCKCSGFFVVAPSDMSASDILASCDSLPFAHLGQFVFSPIVG